MRGLWTSSMLKEEEEEEGGEEEEDMYKLLPVDKADHLCLAIIFESVCANDFMGVYLREVLINP